jgi:PST family polysaccharide transporter
LAINTVLARLLGPRPFGQLALVMTVIGLGNLLVESGMGVSLVQKSELDELDVRYVFTVQMAAGLILAGLLALGAPVTAAALGQPELSSLLRVLPWMLAIQAFGQTGTALLRRDLNFANIQKLQIVSYLAGYLAIGIPLALRGHGVWSLAFAQMAQSTIYSIGAWILTRHSVRPYWSHSRHPLATFGLKVATTNIASWAVGALPTLLIGRFQGVVQLGYYSRAYFLVAAPASALAASLQSTSLSLYSRMQRHLRVTARTYLGLTSVCQMLTAPLFCAIAAMPHAIIETLFGSKWSPAADLLCPLALAMPLDVLAALASPLLIARGRPGLEFRSQMVTAAAAVVIVGWMAKYSSTVATTWAVFGGVYLVRMIATTGAVLPLLGLSSVAWARAAAGPVLLGALCFAGVYGLDGALSARGFPGSLRLMLLSAAGCAGSLLALWLAPRRILRREGIALLMGGVLRRGSMAHTIAQRWIASNG